MYINVCIRARDSLIAHTTKLFDYKELRQVATSLIKPESPNMNPPHVDMFNSACDVTNNVNIKSEDENKIGNIDEVRRNIMQVRNFPVRNSALTIVE